ncbi:MAG: GNAT family N-acetyltransferase, partial [Oscillibacter sp.]|nr:GNAT family N-acetyltransferase [Oscillibacter sp.]
MIRPATAADLPAVVAIYNAIFDQEERSGTVYTHWERSSYPTPDTARTAFEAGTLFVGETDGVIWGSMNLNGIQLPEYKKINWSIPAADSEVAVIHTLTIDPAKAGHG